MQNRSDTRRELGEFLRSRRERITPATVGLPKVGRRRTPGLRREEVAQLSGVGVTWYTWLEQGRDIRVSTEVLERLAGALRLSPSERSHLFILAQHAPPLDAPSPVRAVAEQLQQLLDGMPRIPAYIKNRRWDVLAWNRAATMIFGDFGQQAPSQRNILWQVFANPSYRETMTDWERDARRVLAFFRADYTVATPADPSFQELVDQLERFSPTFEEWWHQHDVADLSSLDKQWRHPSHGVLSFHYASFVVDGVQDLRLVTYTPVPDEENLRRVARALAEPE